MSYLPQKHHLQFYLSKFWGDKCLNNTILESNPFNKNSSLRISSLNWSDRVLKYFEHRPNTNIDLLLTNNKCYFGENDKSVYQNHWIDFIPSPFVLKVIWLPTFDYASPFWFCKKIELKLFLWTIHIFNTTDKLVILTKQVSWKWWNLASLIFSASLYVSTKILKVVMYVLGIPGYSDSNWIMQYSIHLWFMNKFGMDEWLFSFSQAFPYLNDMLNFAW